MTGREYYQQILNKTQFIISSPFSEEYPRAVMELKIDLEKTKLIFERVGKTDAENAAGTKEILDKAIQNLENAIHEASEHLVLCVDLLDSEVIFPAKKQIEKAKEMLKQDPTNDKLKNSLTNLENETKKIEDASAAWSNYGEVPSVKLTTLIRQLTHSVDTLIHDSTTVKMSEFEHLQFTLNDNLLAIHNASDAFAVRGSTLNSRIDVLQTSLMILAVPTALLAFVFICRTPTLLNPIKYVGGRMIAVAGFAASGFGLFSSTDANSETSDSEDYIPLSPSSRV